MLNERSLCQEVKKIDQKNFLEFQTVKFERILFLFGNFMAIIYHILLN